MSRTVSNCAPSLPIIGCSLLNTPVILSNQPGSWLVTDILFCEGSSSLKFLNLISSAAVKPSGILGFLDGSNLIVSSIDKVILSCPIIGVFPLSKPPVNCIVNACVVVSLNESFQRLLPLLPPRAFIPTLAAYIIASVAGSIFLLF